MKQFALVLLCGLLAAVQLNAEVSLPSVISSNMVLQQQMKVPIWGAANPGEKVTVTFAGQTKSTVADEKGAWRVDLDAMKATNVPAVMTVAGENTLILENVVIGEVWIASGQSNMAYAMARGTMAPPAKGEDLAEKELQKPANPQIRVLMSSRAGAVRLPGAQQQGGFGGFGGQMPQGMPQGGPQGARPQGMPQGGPQGAMPQGMPQGGPQGAMPQGGPWGQMPQGGAMPQGMPQGGPQGAMPQGMPQGGRGQGAPRGMGMRAPGWAEASSESLPRQSAVGYFFGKELAENLKDIPIGIITAAVGGTRIEPWTDREAYLEDERFAAEMKEKGTIDDARPNEQYDSYIAPLVPFAIRGFIWYQGEQNQSQSDRRYDQKMEVLVKSWRKAFENEDAAFYYVLLAPHIYSDRLHRGHAVTADELPVFWEMQEKAQYLPHAGMTVVSDLVDTLTDIHPSYKWEVGRRLSLHALAKDYGRKDIVYSGPIFKSVAYNASQDALEVSFDYVAGGLAVAENGKALKTFEIAAADGEFKPAEAVIKDNKVIVKSAAVKKPVSVRMGWHETFRPNLVNSAGLPAAPFRATVAK